jgi:hypothetical protein
VLRSRLSPGRSSPVRRPRRRRRPRRWRPSGPSGGVHRRRRAGPVWLQLQRAGVAAWGSALPGPGRRPWMLRRRHACRQPRCCSPRHQERGQPVPARPVAVAPVSTGRAAALAATGLLTRIAASRRRKRRWQRGRRAGHGGCGKWASLLLGPRRGWWSDSDSPDHQLI